MQSPADPEGRKILAHREMRGDFFVGKDEKVAINFLGLININYICNLDRKRYLFQRLWLNIR